MTKDELTGIRMRYALDYDVEHSDGERVDTFRLAITDVGRLLRHLEQAEPTGDAPNFLEDGYHRALDKLVMARTFMTLEAQQAFDEEWERHMQAGKRTAALDELVGLSEGMGGYDLDPTNKQFLLCPNGHVAYSISFDCCPSCKVVAMRASQIMNRTCSND